MADAEVRDIDPAGAIATGRNGMKAKYLGLATALVAATALSFAAVAFGGSYTPGTCGGKQIVNVTYTLTNDYDSGFVSTNGGNWANDTVTRSLKVFDLGGGNYC